MPFPASLSALPRKLPESPRPWLLVFDLDGTLIDSSEDLCRSVNAALEAVQKPPLSPATVASFIGNGAEALVRRALHAAERSAESASFADQESEFRAAHAFFLQFYREHKLDHTRLYQGVLEALTSLKARQPSILMAVLSNKPVRPTREICQALGLSKFFFLICGGDSFSTKKPDPEGLLSLLETAKEYRRENDRSLDQSKNGVVMIGDSEVDVLMARRARVRSLGCAYGLAPEALALACPDACVFSPAAWPMALPL